MIRWPRDALIFSVRVRGCGVYAAGYVEGDTLSQEILGARKTSQGLDLVAIRAARFAPAPLEVQALRRLATANVPGVAPVLDAFVPLAALQPTSSSSLGDVERIMVVEALPAHIHLGDLARRLFRSVGVGGDGGAPPLGLALCIAREAAVIYDASVAFPLPADGPGTSPGATCRCG